MNEIEAHNAEIITAATTSAGASQALSGERVTRGEERSMSRRGRSNNVAACGPNWCGLIFLSRNVGADLGAYMTTKGLKKPFEMDPARRSGLLLIGSEGMKR